METRICDKGHMTRAREVTCHLSIFGVKSDDRRMFKYLQSGRKYQNYKFQCDGSSLLQELEIICPVENVVRK